MKLGDWFGFGCGVFLPRLPAHRESVTDNALVERFFLGKELVEAELRWEGLLKSYWSRARRFSKRLIAIIGAGFGLAPPVPSEVGELLDWLTRLCGGLARLSLLDADLAIFSGFSARKAA